MLEDSLDLLVDAELEVVRRSSPRLIRVIPFFLSATSFAASMFDFFRSSFLNATQTCYQRQWTLMDSKKVSQKFERYSTFQPTMPLTLLPP